MQKVKWKSGWQLRVKIASMNGAHRKYLPEFVYGSMDGLVTTFAIVTGAAGASLNPVIILIVGLANVLADAFSMGSSGYLSAKSEESLGQNTEHGKNALMQGIITFTSFVIVGMIPLVPYVMAVFDRTLVDRAIWLSIIFTGIAFAAVGYASGRVANRNPWLSMLQHLAIGGIAALIAFGVGHYLSQAFGV